MALNLVDYIASIPDFPSKGILFRDVTPLIQNGEAFQEVTNQLESYARKVKADVIVGPESRGFIFGCPLAVQMGIGFIPVRKPGKLPRETISKGYTLEYGTNEVFMHKDAIQSGQRVLIVDDLLATGGTAKATCEMVEELGGTVAGCAFIIELYGNGMEGREVLKDYDVFSMVELSDQ
ncbi:MULTISPECIES: adenine phosphoribosyltransferase [Terrabacteria group]|uniref:adenine phosphoribosyltransferase n=1 Tax=Bacillati TaxID=1783272 RepID=UPI001939EB35|nr:MULTISPECIES: adenine phosphoribosyltransferase [Terrabacteria group]MBW9212302.1 adenine phosphoribosyltransferase [Trueperella sp. zg.1013]QRG86161.1 adenine phosphoribosyltransferase [Bulleidia sp. zg-1006]